MKSSYLPGNCTDARRYRDGGGGIKQVLLGAYEHRSSPSPIPAPFLGKRIASHKDSIYYLYGWRRVASGSVPLVPVEGEIRTGRVIRRLD